MHIHIQKKNEWDKGAHINNAVKKVNINDQLSIP